MLICAAQISSVPGEVAENISRHLQLVDCAGNAGARCVVFPELSITGYEPTLAEALAISHLQIAFELDGILIAPAICYESLLPEHAAGAAEMGANVYLASVSKPDHNVERAYSCFPELARRHSMTVLMCNAIGPSSDFIGAGSSAGNLIGRAGERDEGLLFVDLASKATSFQQSDLPD